MPSGDPADSRLSPSKRWRSGWTHIAASGKRVSNAWMSIYASFKRRRRMVTQSNSPTMTVTLPSDREIKLTRDFDAPRNLVFEACTKPEHLKHWWGPRGYDVILCEGDLRPGGAWRTVQRAPDGNEYAFRGEFRE